MAFHEAQPLRKVKASAQGLSHEGRQNCQGRGLAVSQCCSSKRCAAGPKERTRSATAAALERNLAFVLWLPHVSGFVRIGTRETLDKLFNRLREYQ